MAALHPKGAFISCPFNKLSVADLIFVIDLTTIGVHTELYVAELYHFIFVRPGACFQAINPWPWNRVFFLEQGFFSPIIH